MWGGFLIPRKITEGVEDIRTLAPPKRRLPLCSTVLKVWFWSYSQGETARFCPPHRSLRSDRGETRASIQGGVLRLGASSVAMSFATAPFCKTHRQNPSASFPTGAAGGDKTRRLTCASASWFEGGSPLHDGRRVSGGAGVRISSTPSDGLLIMRLYRGGRRRGRSTTHPGCGSPLRARASRGSRALPP